MLAGVELSYLNEEEQNMIAALPLTLAQAKELRKRSEAGQFHTDELIPNKNKVSFTPKAFKPYFPKGYSPEQMMERIIALLQTYGIEEK